MATFPAHDMTLAIGVIETTGVPAALAVADAMGKTAAVDVVRIENTDRGWISVIIRGTTGNVHTAIATAEQTLQSQPGADLIGHHILPCPDGSLEDILPVRRTDLFPGNHWVEWLDD